MERLQTLPWWSLLAAAVAETLQHGRDRLARAWHQMTLDADERYLGGATDLADLERRLRQLDRGQPLRDRWMDSWR